MAGTSRRHLGTQRSKPIHSRFLQFALPLIALLCGAAVADPGEVPVFTSPETEDGEPFESQDAKVPLEWDLPTAEDEESDPSDPEAGMFTTDSAGPEFELQQATEADFSDAVTRYEGPDRGSILTGLAEGTYHFRVRSISSGEGDEKIVSDWSEPLVAEVEFFGRTQVLLLLAAGFAVVAATIGAVLHGHFRHRSDS